MPQRREGGQDGMSCQMSPGNQITQLGKFNFIKNILA